MIKKHSQGIKITKIAVLSKSCYTGNFATKTIKNYTIMNLRFLLLLTMLLTMGNIASATDNNETKKGVLTGKLLSDDKSPVIFASVQLQNTKYGCVSDDEGLFRMEIPAGKYTIVVSAVGYKKIEKEIHITAGEHVNLNIPINSEHVSLDAVEVVASNVEKVRHSPYNAVALDTKEFVNYNKNLAEMLTKLPGIKLRENGGVGSDMQLMMDGFGGKHIRIFIDGIPQEGVGTSFNLNNVPINFARSIEVYKGVVPVEFGSDALGGVINIVTDKRVRKWFADASYSFGSFNTHKSYLNFGQTLRCGLAYEVNLFQNYSDNNYYIHNWVRHFKVNNDGSISFPPIDKSDIRRVKRFNDTFHNETASGKIGFINKKWADRIMFAITYTNFYKEIQTGVYQETVFGDKHRKGYSLMPSFEYLKRNIFLKNLTLKMSVNYNHNVTHNIDTSALAYNWEGKYYNKGNKGEQSYQKSESMNKNWNATINITYRIGQKHLFSLNHVYNSFKRSSRRSEGSQSVLTNFDIPKITRKNISGLSYRFYPSEKWNISLFGKYYNQYNKGPVSTSNDGIGNYINLSKSVSDCGYGTATTYYITNNFQAKFSYEKSYRLPTNDELFGDEDLEAGKTDLKPENSNNFNFNLSYTKKSNRHSVFVEGSLIYRDTKDYIKRGIGKYGALQYGIYENHGHVKTKGYNVSINYNYANWLGLGGTFNSIDVRDYERYIAGDTEQKSMHYKVRLPNIPYLFANFDATFTFNNIFTKDSRLTVVYDGLWQHSFPLYWENIGSSQSKAKVPEQLSHNIGLTYSFKDGKYNLSLECKNITDERLYDNFSLQKAGRAFYAKARVYFNDNN